MMAMTASSRLPLALIKVCSRWRSWWRSPARSSQDGLLGNAASTGFVLDLPSFSGIDTETLGALAGTLADAAPERCTVQVLHWASPRFGASAEAWAEPRADAGEAMARMGERRGKLLAHGGWRKLHAGGPPFTLSDYRVFVTACLAGGPGPAVETGLGAFRRALEGTLASVPYPTKLCKRIEHDGNLLRDPAGENPDRSRLATSRNRVLRGPGVTPAAKRTQRACRPRD